jgi:hypothetical protein
MTSTDELKTVSDADLLRRLADLVRQARRVEAVLIAHIAEVDARRLYIREAPSMFAYCTQVLHLSEHETYARITVARASRRYPVLLAMLRDGRLHASGIGKLVPHLTDANADELLARATHKTKRQIEEFVAAIVPKPDVPAAVRKVPVRHAMTSWGELGPDRVAMLGDALLVPFAPTVRLPQPGLALPPPAAPVAVTPVSPARYKVQFTASAALRDKLERLQALMREDLATAIEGAVTEKLERLEAKRFGLTKAPRKSLDETDTSPRSRYLPASVRRSVRERDGDQCTFALRSGSRCPERRSLEFHHREPYGRGGAHDPDNVCLMCRQHNAYVAELDYGKERMEKYRRRGDHVSEGTPEYANTCLDLERSRAVPRTPTYLDTSGWQDLSIASCACDA